MLVLPCVGTEFARSPHWATSPPMSLRSWRSPTVARPPPPPVSNVVLPVPSPMQLCLVYPGKPYMPHTWTLQLTELADSKEARKMEEAVNVLERVGTAVNNDPSMWQSGCVCGSLGVYVRNVCERVCWRCIMCVACVLLLFSRCLVSPAGDADEAAAEEARARAAELVKIASMPSASLAQLQSGDVSGLDASATLRQYRTAGDRGR